MSALQSITAPRMANTRRLRLLVSITIISVLAWFLLNALERETRRAEEMSANMVIGQLRSALVIKGAEVILGQKDRLENYNGINPFELLEHQWTNYTGLCRDHKVKSAAWCFLPLKQKATAKEVKGWLIYSPGQPITVDRRAIQKGQLTGWAVTTEFADRNRNGQQDEGERSTGLKLVLVTLPEEVTAVLKTEN
ncbi:MAG TPA: hypothetical protein VL091_00815 [Marinobacter sp.]|nr:hypothetical protein [Marinobacter sp.]